MCSWVLTWPVMWPSSWSTRLHLNPEPPRDSRNNVADVVQTSDRVPPGLLLGGFLGMLRGEPAEDPESTGGIMFPHLAHSELQ